MRTLALIAAATLTGGCFGARSIQRNYYVLNVDSPRESNEPVVPGHLYVADLACDRIYDKARIVLRRSPYVLTYSTSQVWAIRPSRMIADLVARSLYDRGTFTTVSRQLAEGRPTYSLNGHLRAIEVQVGHQPWRVRLAFELELTRFDDGALMWSHRFDETRETKAEDYDQAVQTASRMLEQALEASVDGLMDRSDAIQSLPVERRARRRAAEDATE